MRNYNSNKAISYKVSIVTATYNSSSVIRKCLASVASQTSIDLIEHIIIDGGSTDNTLDVVSEFPHVRVVVSESDRGIYHAFNKGLDIASGELIYYLGSDDYIFNTTVMEKIISLIGTDIDFICGAVVLENPVSGLRWDHVGRDVSVSGNIYKHPSHQSFFIKTSVFKSVYGGFPECFKIHADSYIMLRAISELKGMVIPENIAIFSVSGMSNSCENTEKNQRELALVYELLSVGRENDLYSVSAAYLNNFQTMKVLVSSLLNKKIKNNKSSSSYMIFGIAELSLIMFELLTKHDVVFSGFVTTRGVKHGFKGFPVHSLDELKGDEIIINGVEGAHAQSVTELIKSKCGSVTVIGWKEFVDELLSP